MLIQGKGISVDAHVDGSRLVYIVTEQTKEATKALELLGLVRDKETGYTLRTNNRPSYNSKKKRFFVRGREKDYDNETVTAKLSYEEAPRALEALKRLIAKVKMPVATATGGGIVYAKGGTSGVRFALIDRDIAMSLDLTGKNHYPFEPFWIPGTAPVITENRHYNEHIGQVVDVLNKAHEASTPDDDILINPHKVTPAQARQAIAAVREGFRAAKRGGYEVAYWRTITGIRGPDHVDDEEKKKEPDANSVPRHP